MFRLTIQACLLTAVLFVGSGAARSGILIEDFEDPFPEWKNRWLALNSNLTNNMEEANTCYGVDCRGNNPDGLWIADGIPGQMDTFITFNPAFAATLTSLQLDLTGWQPTTLEIYDSDGATLLSTLIELTDGATTDPGVYATYRVASSTGIREWSLLNWGTKVEGNVSIDNVIVTTGATSGVPGSAPILGALAAFNAARKLRQRLSRAAASIRP